MRPPSGESLADTAARAAPYFQAHILPHVTAGENVLVVAYGNSLRAIVEGLDGLASADVPTLEIPTGTPYVYTITPDGSVTGKEIRPLPAAHTDTP